ncbi:MAG: membrane-bound lytic murein transglycosylase MltF [Betaproteobacteria bacterium]|nr:membrane-bound lytic murein transglycosylase MltF [Betaproteobacteria bacterium]
MPKSGGELVVATRNSPTTYFLDGEGKATGFEHDLVRRFAEAQGWSVRFETMESLDGMFRAVRNGRVHIAAAGLTVTEERGRQVAFGPAYGQVQELLVCREGVTQPARLEQIKGLRLEVVAGSSHALRLKQAQRRAPGLKWVEVVTPGEEELLERVDAGLADCTVADSDNLDVARNFHPSLREGLVLASRQQHAWALKMGVDVSLSRKLSTFFHGMERSGELARLRERYFGHVTRLAEADVRGVLERRVERLHPLRAHLYAGQIETGLDWRLLAAVAYQESQWDAAAVSPTGVRGIMMLTSDTADRLGVKDRLDPRESILGGARYLVMLRAGQAEDIPEPDRTWMALAAYNIGPAHLEDARTLARRLGKNPNRWSDMKEVLPLIAHPRHYAGLRYGFARGGEARTFAENVRIYYDILNRFERPYRNFWSLD